MFLRISCEDVYRIKKNGGVVNTAVFVSVPKRINDRFSNRSQVLEWLRFSAVASTFPVGTKVDRVRSGRASLPCAMHRQNH